MRWVMRGRKAAGRSREPYRRPRAADQADNPLPREPSRRVVIHQAMAFIGYADTVRHPPARPKETLTVLDLAQCAFCAIGRFSRTGHLRLVTKTLTPMTDSASAISAG